MVFRDSLGRRLAPLYIASFLGGLALWVPIEKLFMTEIGFTSSSVGIMAAVYAVVVPVLEVPSGVLADRWSRRGVLILGTIAVIISVLIGGFSQDVTVYVIGAAFLGVYFALQSGTLESVVYDTVLEETGDSEAFERTIGQVRLVESIALVASALAGGLIAQLAPLRATYFLTVPLLLLSTLMLLRFREPQLHKTEERESLRAQLRATYRTIMSGGDLRTIIALTVVGALLMLDKPALLGEAVPVDTRLIAHRRQYRTLVREFACGHPTDTSPIHHRCIVLPAVSGLRVRTGLTTVRS